MVDTDLIQPNALTQSALEVAQLRALHQRIDQPLVFHDPLALRVVGMNDNAPVGDRVIAATRTTRAFIAARSRFAEDELACAIERGVTQYVILGAGLDTYAYRHPSSVPHIKIFEIDHPQTQAWKRTLLKERQILEPPNLVYLAIDFNHSTLREKLAASDFRFDQSTFISLLGVVIYLERTVVTDLFRFFSERLPSANIVFDYGVEDALLSEQQRTQRSAAKAHAARLGQPFKTFFKPEELFNELTSLGYREIENIDPPSINERYFSSREDNLCVAGDGRRLMSARF